MFIRAVLPGAVVEAVELDPAVADIARESFGVVDGDGACFVMFGGRAWEVVLGNWVRVRLRSFARSGATTRCGALSNSSPAAHGDQAGWWSRLAMG